MDAAGKFLIDAGLNEEWSHVEERRVRHELEGLFDERPNQPARAHEPAGAEPDDRGQRDLLGRGRLQRADRNGRRSEGRGQQDVVAFKEGPDAPCASGPSSRVSVLASSSIRRTRSRRRRSQDTICSRISIATPSPHSPRACATFTASPKDRRPARSREVSSDGHPRCTVH